MHYFSNGKRGKESILYQAQAGGDQLSGLINWWCEGREIDHFVQNLGLLKRSV